MAVIAPERVVIADDHAPTRTLVRNALERGGFTVVAEAPDASSAISAVQATTPEVALLDIRMPGNGIAAAAEIAAQQPATSIVMLTVSQDDDDLFGALRAGASGYLLKGMDPAELPGALRAVLAGEAAMSGTLVARLVSEFRARDRRRFLGRPGHPGERLTEREWEVVELLEQGFTTADMAERLFIAKVTVRTHISAILHKLRVPNRDAAVELLRRQHER
ncbi:MAG TPA: response regulator transcription factor [Acidimicrobiales bacterium]|jgi:DNA-binding NarL/FixJ family response regulator|nr:response regulator transcription factor [Acidimicrobiales bacterium]